MQKISAKDLYDKLQAEEPRLIDVREVDEFTAGHISGAQNLPLSTLPENYGKLDKQIPYCNKQYYGQFHKYTGKAKIDDYEMIADGAGAIVHWVSTTPEEDKKMAGHF